MTVSDTSHGTAETPPSTPFEVLPIGPAEVRLGVAREVQFLAGLGLVGPDALARAIEITAAKIRNSPVLIERQSDNTRCHTCGDPLDGSRPEIAILQAKGGKHLWLHGGECHEANSRRRVALVDAIMRAAGYGPDQWTGVAA